jgi:hypothetical protein
MCLLLIRKRELQFNPYRPCRDVHGAVVQVLDVLRRRVCVVAGDAVGVGGHEAEAAVAHREDREETSGGQEDRELVLRHFAGQIHVAEHVVLLDRAALERQPQRLADRTVRAVGRDHVGRRRHLGPAIRVA